MRVIFPAPMCRIELRATEWKIARNINLESLTTAQRHSRVVLGNVTTVHAYVDSNAAMLQLFCRENLKWAFWSSLNLLKLLHRDCLAGCHALPPNPTRAAGGAAEPRAKAAAELNDAASFVELFLEGFRYTNPSFVTSYTIGNGCSSPLCS